MTDWRDREAWDRLCRGEGCPLCETIGAGFDEDAHGVTLRRTAASVIRLKRDQRARGACVVISTRHVVEPFELPAAERQPFFDDVLAAAQAVRDVVSPIKINYEVLGNNVPHLHCHLVPRYADDGAPGEPLSIFTGPAVGLPDPEFHQLEDELRAALKSHIEGDDDLRFEPLGMNDLPSLQELCESCADYYHLMTGAAVPRSEADTLFTLRPETAAFEDKFLVAVRRGQRRLVGVLDLYRHYPRRNMAWLGLLLLHPDFRGHGYGAAMISWLLDWAKEQGCGRIRVAVADDNQRGFAVLKRHGFIATGEKISRVSGSRRLVLVPLERPL